MARRGLTRREATRPEARGDARRQIARPRSIAGASLEENAVGGTELASGSTDAQRAVGTSHIKDGAVTRSKIPVNAISGAELASGSVGDTHISGRLGKGRIDPSGQWPKSDLPNDTVYGNAQGRLEYKDIGGAFPGIKSIPSNVAKDTDLTKLRAWVKKNFRAK